MSKTKREKQEYPPAVTCVVNFFMLVALTCFFGLLASFFPPTWHPHAISPVDLLAFVAGSVSITVWALLMLGRRWVDQHPSSPEEKAKA